MMNNELRQKHPGKKLIDFTDFCLVYVLQVPWERAQICTSKWKGPGVGKQGM